MLERVAIVGHIVIIIIRISEKGVASGKHITRRQIGLRQQGLAWVFDHKQALVVIISQILAQFVPQVGIGIAVAHNLDRFGTTDTAMIGCHNDLTPYLCLSAKLLFISENRYLLIQVFLLMKVVKY